MQTIPDSCSIYQKINYIEIRRQKNNVTFSVVNVHRVQWCMHSLFSSCLMKPCEEFLCHGNGSPDEILSICSHRRIGKCIPKLILTGWIRTRCQVVFDNEHSLHLWKRHPCTSTVWRQLTVWRKQVTKWRDLRGLLYSHSDIVCLLIQSNCTELQPSIN
jgi:hypothetical protein